MYKVRKEQKRTRYDQKYAREREKERGIHRMSMRALFALFVRFLPLLWRTLDPIQSALEIVLTEREKQSTRPRRPKRDAHHARDERALSRGNKERPTILMIYHHRLKSCLKNVPARPRCVSAASRARLKGRRISAPIGDRPATRSRRIERRLCFPGPTNSSSLLRLL